MSNNKPFSPEYYSELERVLDNLFPNFKYRPNQKEMILALAYSFLYEEKKYGVLSAPIGSGKSIIANHLAHLLVSMGGLETLTLTKTISLQNQYLRDFSEMRKLMGATNYECHTDEVGFIPPSKKFHPTCKYHSDSGLCEYSRARSMYESSPYKLLNYAFWLNGLALYNTSDVLIVDEAHNIEENILEWAKLEVNLIHLNERSMKIIGVPLNDFFGESYNEIEYLDEQTSIPLTAYISSTVSIVKSRISECESSVEEQIARLESIENDPNATPEQKKSSKKIAEVIKEQITKTLNPLQDFLKYLEWMAFQLKLATECNFENYSKDSKVEEDNSRTLILKPIFCSDIIMNRVFKAKHVVFMSGTAERISTSLRLPAEDTIELSIPYLFPLENRPFYVLELLPALNAGNFETVFPDYIELLDSVIENYPENCNIIIHSHSYKNAEKTLQLSKHSNRMIIPSSEQVRELETFMRDGDIIVSPSITEGVDLGGNRVKAQIFLKCPYPYLGDQWVRDKMKLDDGWYSYQAMFHVVQGSGRAVRSPTDKCDTYFLDSGFRRLLGQNINLVPDWFKKCITWIEKD